MPMMKFFSSSTLPSLCKQTVNPMLKFVKCLCNFALKLASNRLLIPLRYVSNQLDAKVTWHNESKSITVSKDEKVIELTIDLQQVLVNGAEVSLEVPAKVYYGGSTYVPLRFVSVALGASISWNQKAQQATITTADKQIVVGVAPAKPVPKQKAT